MQGPNLGVLRVSGFGGGGVEVQGFGLRFTQRASETERQRDRERERDRERQRERERDVSVTFPKPQNHRALNPRKEQHLQAIKSLGLRVLGFRCLTHLGDSGLGVRTKFQTP